MRRPISIPEAKLEAIQIRPARWADLPAIASIYNNAVLTTTATYDYEPRTAEAQSAWFEEHRRAGYPVFVAERLPGQVLGWSALSAYRPRPGYRFTVEDAIYVAEGERGKGAGKLLLLPIIEAARAMGMQAIIATIDSASMASLRLHRRFGFEEAGRLKQAGFKFDRWLDVIYMELLLR